jgi:hypothetical protein
MEMWRMTQAEYVQFMSEMYEDAEPELLEAQKTLWEREWLQEIQKTDIHIPRRVFDSLPDGYKKVLVQTNKNVKKMLGLSECGHFKPVQDYIPNPIETEKRDREIELAEFIASVPLKQYRINERDSRPCVSPKDWKEISNTHRNAVIMLINRNKPVPSNVMADYPDLVF